MSEEASRAPPVPPERPVVALRREHGIDDGALLSAKPCELCSPAELAALIARQDAGLATAADWRAYGCDLEARIGLLTIDNG
jgi:hypothetical protein